MSKDIEKLKAGFDQAGIPYEEIGSGIIIMTPDAVVVYFPETEGVGQVGITVDPEAVTDIDYKNLVNGEAQA